LFSFNHQVPSAVEPQRKKKKQFHHEGREEHEVYNQKSYSNPRTFVRFVISKRFLKRYNPKEQRARKFAQAPKTFTY
jgi:hypothetical protein